MLIIIPVSHFFILRLKIARAATWERRTAHPHDGDLVGL
jgi:hypothetical protein